MGLFLVEFVQNSPCNQKKNFEPWSNYNIDLGERGQVSQL